MVQYGTSITSVGLAVHLVRLIEDHPGSLGTFAREFSSHVSTLCGSGKRVRYLLPLPLPDVTAVWRWAAGKQSGCAPRCRRVARQVAKGAWMFLAVTALNYAYCGR